MRVIEKEAEAHLIELLNLVRDNRQGWVVVSFAFSRLLEHYRNEYQLKIAINLMNDLLGDLDGAIYLCEDANIHVMVRHFSPILLEKMIFQLRYLFMDDPLAYTPEGDENPGFSTTYDMETDWETFTALCKRNLVNRVRKTRGQEREGVASPTSSGFVAGLSGAVAARGALRSLTPANLVAIERDLRSLDVAPCIRRQPICASLPGAPARTVFDELYLNIAQLQEMLGGEVDLLSNRTLFRYLSRTLDVRMLDTIQQSPARYLINPVSLNLNVETLLSNRFAEFDAAIKPSTKVSIVIEIQIADVFNDMAAFITAKDIVQKLGYRVCMDGTTSLCFPQVDRQSVGFDLVKLLWNADTTRQLDSTSGLRLKEAVKRCGANRVILTRCDTHEAVEYGQALGITLFQGRYLDSLVNPQSAVVN